MVVSQHYKVGNLVKLKNAGHPWSDADYTVITVAPVYERRPVKYRIRALFKSVNDNRTIVNYRYRCKCKYRMVDLLQDELITADTSSVVDLDLPFDEMLNIAQQSYLANG